MEKPASCWPDDRRHIRQARPQVPEGVPLPHSARSPPRWNCWPWDADARDTIAAARISYPARPYRPRYPPPTDRVLDVRVAMGLKWLTFPLRGQILAEATWGGTAGTSFRGFYPARELVRH